VSVDLTVRHVPGEITPTGLRLPKKLEYSEWLKVGKQLTRIHEASSWALADWLFYGEWTYGRRYEDALELTGLGYQRLADLKYVAGRFQPSRRHEKLSITHHREVAAFPPEQADQLLAQAEQNGWSCSRLREEVQVRAIRRQPDNGDGSTQAAPRPVPDIVGLAPDTREELVAEWLRTRFGALPGNDWVELAREAIALVEVAA
jgi:hypothetical protein